ncbi:hypothetical protein B6D29_03610 [Microgenomates bacterium UTCPR1]|nr:MAG: hypothetical protein B6D29_03610 [Microgenomates bacterium UTCPR1]
MQKSNISKPNQSQTGYKNPLETIRDLRVGTVKKAANTIGNIGGGMVDQLFGGGYQEESDDEKLSFFQEEIKKNSKKRENRVFNYNEYYEDTLVKRQIKELTELIKKEIEALKKSNDSLLNEVKDVEKLTINALPEKPGVYHIRFLEIILNILRVLRAKVGESKTWMQALISRKKKRGSLFAVRSKKAGTQYSLSQELQLTRSVQ